MGDKEHRPEWLPEESILHHYEPSDFEQPSLSVDTVIFRVDTEERSADYRKLEAQKLTVLMIKRPIGPYEGCWCLPGEFVTQHESLDQAAYRTVKSHTGLEDVYIEQLYTFGAPNRDPRMRVISCAYLALVNCNRDKMLQNKRQDATWFEVELTAEGNLLRLSDEEEFVIPLFIQKEHKGRLVLQNYIPVSAGQLAFDHADIIIQALLRLRGKIGYTDIIFNLMPDTFSISQLQRVYEIILGEDLLAPAFRRKIARKIIETGNFVKDKGFRPSRLFQYRGLSQLEMESF